MESMRLRHHDISLDDKSFKFSSVSEVQNIDLPPNQ